MVVDLAGGWADRHRTRRWSHDTLVNSFSVGKGVLSILLAHQVSQGVIHPDSPVAEIWPQLHIAQNSNITVVDIAAHKAGLPAVRQPIQPEQLYEWTTMCQMLETQPPWWEPGSAHGYHVNTFGFLLGEIIRRSTHSEHTELLSPLRHIITSEMYFGVPTSELNRVADLEWVDAPTSVSPSFSDNDIAPEIQMKLLTYGNPSNFSGIGSVNDTQWRQAVHPSTNLHTTARGVAYIYDALHSKNQSFDVNVIDAFTQTQSYGHDMILDSETHFGIGFQLPTASRRFGPHDEAFGHYGAGGALGFHDPIAQISFGYVMNKMGRGWQNIRNQSLIDALYSCL